MTVISIGMHNYFVQDCISPNSVTCKYNTPMITLNVLMFSIHKYLCHTLFNGFIGMPDVNKRM